MHACESIAHAKSHGSRDNVQLSNVQYLHQSKQVGASGKKGRVHSGRERRAAQGKGNGSGKGVHATALETCELGNYCFIHSGEKEKSRQEHHLPVSGVKDLIFLLMQ